MEYTADSWEELKNYTDARIALGRSGIAMPTHELLKFSAAHAQAKDAVYATINPDLYDKITQTTNLPVIQLHSRAVDRAMYLRRPDLGKRLDDKSLELLSEIDKETDICLIIADGLSAAAINTNVIDFLKVFLSICLKNTWKVPAIYTVGQGRVAVSDQVGLLTRAKVSLILIGERPGLSAPDSMGVYMTYKPQVGNTAERRNCISNIRPKGLDFGFAAYKLAYLIEESMRKKISGVDLKDEYSEQLYATHVKQFYI
jgi:ethanolamine ammonia-lyase small subunit